MLKSTKVPMINPKTGKVVGINVMDVQAALNNKYTYPEQEKTPPQSVAVDDSEGDEEDFDADLNETIGDFMERKTGEKPPVVEAAKQSLPEQQTTTAKEEQKTPPTDTVVPPIKPVASTTAPVVGVAPVKVDQNKKLLDELESVRKPAKEKTELKEALKMQKLLQLYSIMGRGSERIGAGLSGLISRGDAPKIGDDTSTKLVQELGKTQVEQAKEAEKLAKEEEEADPTSDKSKSVQKVLEQYGAPLELVKNVTYKDYKDLGLANLMIKFAAIKSGETKQQASIAAQKERDEFKAKTQKDLFEAKLAAKKDALDLAKSEAKNKSQKQYITSQIEKMDKGKLYNYVREVNQKAKDALQYKKETPSATKDTQLIYNVVRLFDPTSSVKEGEYKLMLQAENAYGRLKAAMSDYNPKDNKIQLSPTVRNQLIDIIQDLKDGAFDDYQTMIRSRAQIAVELYGMDYDSAYSMLDLANPKGKEELQSKTPTALPSSSTTEQAAPSSEVIEKNGLRLRPKN